jgi:hypothetical protein
MNVLCFATHLAGLSANRRNETRLVSLRLHRWFARYASSDGMSTAEVIRADPLSVSLTIHSEVKFLVLWAVRASNR